MGERREHPLNINENSIKEAVAILENFFEEEFYLKTLLKYKDESDMRLFLAARDNINEPDANKFERVRKETIEFQKEVNKIVPYGNLSEDKIIAVIKKLESLPGSKEIEKNLDKLGVRCLFPGESTWKVFIEDTIGDIKRGEFRHWDGNQNLLREFKTKNKLGKDGNRSLVLLENWKYAIFDENNNKISDFFESANITNSGDIAVKKEGKWFIIDRDGHKLSN